jgi:hypothetical protein
MLEIFNRGTSNIKRALVGKSFRKRAIERTGMKWINVLLRLILGIANGSL